MGVDFGMKSLVFTVFAWKRTVRRTGETGSIYGADGR